MEGLGDSHWPVETKVRSDEKKTAFAKDGYALPEG